MRPILSSSVAAEVGIPKVVEVVDRWEEAAHMMLEEEEVRNDLVEVVEVRSCLREEAEEVLHLSRLP